MLQEAAIVGFYVPEYFPDQRFPRVQILTIAELLQGQQSQYPRSAPTATFRPASRRQKGADPQQTLLYGSVGESPSTVNRLDEAPRMASAHAWGRARSPICEGKPTMTHTEITQAIEKLTQDIRTLSYSSTKAAAEKILHLQQRRRELRAQFEAAEP